MNSEEFVDRIRIAVYDGSVTTALSILDKPPGRNPSMSQINNSTWYHQLSPEESVRLKSVIRDAVRGAVFSMLCVLDGVASIRKHGEEVGSLELRYVCGSESVLLNPEEGEMLHDSFAGLVPPE
jgi:hypothetical protein